MTRNDNISRTAITIKLLGVRNLDYMSYPVTFGVPFADDVLENGIPVQIIDGSGKAWIFRLCGLAVSYHV